MSIYIKREREIRIHIYTFIYEERERNKKEENVNYARLQQDWYASLHCGCPSRLMFFCLRMLAWNGLCVL